MSMNIRPKGMSGYFGQSEAKEKLQMMIGVYKKTGKVPEPILLTAKPGFGKTTLARAFANEMGVDFIEVFGPMLRKEEDVFDVLRNGGAGIKRGSIIFIDECHSISAQAQVMLLPILEDGRLQHGKFNWKFPDWCFIFGTTNPGMLSKPLYERMVNKIQLKDYTVPELSSIGYNSSKALGFNVTKDVLDSLGSISFGTPRLMNAFIKAMSNYVIAKGIDTFGMHHLNKFLKFYGVDNKGLNISDYAYLKCLYTNVQNGVRVPTGVRAIMKRTGLTSDEVDNIVEPKLLSMGFIGLSGRGRILLDDGIEYTRKYVITRA